MSTTKTNPNGQVRKTLASQLDRLDGILDGLSDGLNEAVAGAVQQAVGVAVREAVKSLVAEVVANPDVFTLLCPAADSPNPGARPEKGLVGRAWDWVKARLQAGFQAALRVTCGCVRGVARLRSPVLAALLGVAAALAAYFAAGPWLSGAAGRAAALAAKAGPALHRPAWAPACG